MKNLLQKLNSMNILDLRYICRELGVSSKGGKKIIVNRLLQPLNRKYQMENVTLEEISFDNLKEDWERAAASCDVVTSSCAVG